MLFVMQREHVLLYHAQLTIPLEKASRSRSCYKSDGSFFAPFVDIPFVQERVIIALPPRLARKFDKNHYFLWSICAQKNVKSANQRYMREKRKEKREKRKVLPLAGEKGYRQVGIR